MRGKPFWRHTATDLAGLAALFGAAVAIGWYARRGQPTPGRFGRSLPYPVYSLAEFKTAVAGLGAVILDARAKTDFDRGHVPGAYSVPDADFDATYPQIKAGLDSRGDPPVIVYCSNQWCGLADDVEKKLIARGYPRVGEFPDGWDAWRGQGLPVEGHE